MIGVREGFLPIPLPATLTEYYTPDVPWDGGLWWRPNRRHTRCRGVRQIEPRTFRLGHPTTVRWNIGVFGPAFPNDEPLYAAAGLTTSYVDLPLVTDQGPAGRARP